MSHIMIQVQDSTLNRKVTALHQMETVLKEVEGRFSLFRSEYDYDASMGISEMLKTMELVDAEAYDSELARVIEYAEAGAKEFSFASGFYNKIREVGINYLSAYLLLMAYSKIRDNRNQESIEQQVENQKATLIRDAEEKRRRDRERKQKQRNRAYEAEKEAGIRQLTPEEKKKILDDGPGAIVYSVAKPEESLDSALTRINNQKLIAEHERLAELEQTLIQETHSLERTQLLVDSLTARVKLIRDQIDESKAMIKARTPPAVIDWAAFVAEIDSGVNSSAESGNI